MAAGVVPQVLRQVVLCALARICTAACLGFMGATDGDTVPPVVRMVSAVWLASADGWLRVVPAIGAGH